MKFHLENPPQRTVSLERSKLFRRQSISNLPGTPIISSTSGTTPKSCPPVLPAYWPSIEESMETVSELLIQEPPTPRMERPQLSPSSSHDRSTGSARLAGLDIDIPFTPSFFFDDGDWSITFAGCSYGRRLQRDGSISSQISQSIPHDAVSSFGSPVLSQPTSPFGSSFCTNSEDFGISFQWKGMRKSTATRASTSTTVYSMKSVSRRKQQVSLKKGRQGTTKRQQNAGVRCLPPVPRPEQPVELPPSRMITTTTTTTTTVWTQPPAPDHTAVPEYITAQDMSPDRHPFPAIPIPPRSKSRPLPPRPMPNSSTTTSAAPIAPLQPRRLLPVPNCRSLESPCGVSPIIGMVNSMLLESRSG